jgi:hypothetical protein
MASATTARTSRPKRATWPYRFALIDLGDLFVDDAYQRPLTSFVEQVTRDYNPALVGTLIVSERPNGSHAVIDGQTRMEGMRRNGEAVAPCLVYHDLSREQEADLFAELQTKRRGMATYLRFRSQLVAKRPEALAIQQIVTGAGFDLDVELRTATVKAIAALEFVYRRDPDLLGQVMNIIAAAWPDPLTQYRTAGEIIRGLAVFLRREKRIDEARLIDRLSGVTPGTLRHRANALREGAGSGSGSTSYMADAILGVYMRTAGGRRAGAA